MMIIPKAYQTAIFRFCRVYYSLRKSTQHRTRDLRISSNPIPRGKDRRRTELSRVIPLNWLPSAHLPTYLPTFVLVYRREERERESERSEMQRITPGIRKTRKRTRNGRGRRVFTRKSDRVPLSRWWGINFIIKVSFFSSFRIIWELMTFSRWANLKLQ